MLRSGREDIVRALQIMSISGRFVENPYLFEIITEWPPYNKSQYIDYVIQLLTEGY